MNGMKYEQCENCASVITLCMLLTYTAVGQVVERAPVTQRARFDPRSGQVSWVRFFLTCKTNVRKL